MKNLVLLSFDIEEFDLPEEYGASVAEEEKFSISELGTRNILEILECCKIRATFFVTGKFAQKFPDIIAKMVADGHEIASHGMDHSRFEVADLLLSRQLLEKLSGKPITGFRMARLAEVDKCDILNAGYEYESSLNPVWLPGRYNNFSAPLKPFQEKCSLWQFPASAIPVVRFPLFWLSFKNLPLGFYLFLCKIAMRSLGFFNMYSHPWEYNAASADKKWQIPGYITRHAGQEQCRRLECLIEYFKKRAEFVTFEEYLRDIIKTSAYEAAK